MKHSKPNSRPTPAHPDNSRASLVLNDPERQAVIALVEKRQFHRAQERRMAAALEQLAQSFAAAHQLQPGPYDFQLRGDDLALVRINHGPKPDPLPPPSAPPPTNNVPNA